MWYTWTALLLVSCTLVKAERGAGAEGAVATTRVPPRTLDRQAAELAWKSWLQSPESGNPNAPPRRITTKSLFITPLVCPKGQRLDRNGCIQVVTVNKDEHERILLEQLNALFTTPPNGGADVLYDYGEDEPGPLQLSIPIGLDPQAAPLQGQEPSAQAQQLLPTYVNKKDGSQPANGDASIEAELELLKLQSILNQNDTAGAADGSDILNQNVLTNMQNYPEKPKRDSANMNLTESLINNTDVGQKELVYGHVNVDPVLYNSESQTEENGSTEDIDGGINSTEIQSILSSQEYNGDQLNSSAVIATEILNSNKTSSVFNSSTQLFKKDADQNKLNPENDYSDIGEAIKLISRYADVTTDDNFAKEQKKHGSGEDSVLGTRTKLQYRRNKPKQSDSASAHIPMALTYKDKVPTHDLYQGVYYRYPWPNQRAPTPPADYPFHHLQDYWPGRKQAGGVYNTHENPRRHHHSYPHNFRLRGYPHTGLNVAPAYPEQLKAYIHRVVQRHNNSMRSNGNDQDLYSLLGLRHWFSSEGSSKR